jgi:predicted MPP superfamily phosphohydrolase|tara:strand:+ start:11209 stop:12390 length:1182 start_codon:yes stop_codon:yes gene_type:complete
MDSLFDRIKASFKWKKTSDYCADRLDITIEDYDKLKDIVKGQELLENSSTSYEYNLEKGEAKMETMSSSEPKSPEEIIDILNIDTTKWKLSSYWNKQMGDHWRVSAMVTRLKDNEVDNVIELLKDFKPKKHNIVKRIKTPGKIKTAGVLSLQDIHFGKEGNETIDRDFEETIIDLANRATNSHHLEKLYYVIGGDLINMDTWSGATTSGTPLDNCSTATEAYTQAFDAIQWSINYLKQFCDELQIVYIPGNHDRLSSFHLAYGLSKCFKDDQILWDVVYLERKVYVYEDNFFAFEHGDVNTKNSLLVYSMEYPRQWGKTLFRTLYTGHYHHKKKVEYITEHERTGFMLKILPSLSRSDYYHYHNKFVGSRRSGVLCIHDPKKGEICELTYSPN